MQEVDIIFSIAVLIMSVVVHEVSHGFVANMLGDPTARLAGRLTLNPLPHLDPIGSFLVPLVLHIAGAPVFGWAKPVPYNPHNLSGKFGDAKVAAAGPLSNLFIAVIFGLLLRFVGAMEFESQAVMSILQLIVYINIILAIFNLIPIPPLDGSKVLFSALPYRFRGIQETMERYWLLLIALLIFFLWEILAPIVAAVYRLIVGA
ncbi:site-2 protease family protein [bacterium]|nr:site-2 protease family protein [bacterium]